MADVKLLIDQGNTRIKWIRARNGLLEPETAGRGSYDDFVLASTRNEVNPAAVRISSVAGGEQALVEFCTSQWGVRAEIIKSSAGRGGVRNAYTEPESLGVDRWLAIVGAVAHYGGSLVVWDLGTATTLDAIDESGQHLGGMILPGPATMLDSLVSATKLGVPADLQDSATEPGTSTAAAIRNGVLAAQVGALNQFLRSASETMGAEPRLVVTGGAAESLLPRLTFDHDYDPLLVFRGMLVD